MWDPVFDSNVNPPTMCTGFAQNSFSTAPSTSTSNLVQLVDGYSVYDCQIHTDKTTNTQITCYTPVMLESLYQIRVYVNGNLIPLYQYYDPKQATFAPSLSQTPIISGIIPRSGTPQTLINVTGAWQTACYSRDLDGCSEDNNPLITRVYLGGHLCNLINPSTSAPYTTLTATNLECNFEGSEVGLFNLSMLVSNQYGRTLANSNLFQVSGSEQLYNFQSYAAITSVSPNNGSTQGGTVLTINGQYFDDSTQYPIQINVGDQPCSILNKSLSNANAQTITCSTPSQPTSTQNQYH
ncbi:unnamed protein product, partial [Didymodactylos carnosus]